MSFNDLRLTLPQTNGFLSGELEHRMSIHLVETLCNNTLCASVSEPRELLHILNRCEVDGYTRVTLTIKLFELFSSQKLAIKQHLPLETYEQLVREISFACKALIRDVHPHSDKETASYYHWTLFTLGEEISNYYAQYRPEPRHLWGEIHRLFEAAQLHRLDHYTDPYLACSITDTYKRLILLAVAGPYQFSHNESELLGQWLRHHAELIEFSHQISKHLNHQHYYIDLNQDASIFNYQHIDQSQATDFSILAVNPLPLYEQLKKDLKLIRQGAMNKIKGFADQDAISCFLLLKKAYAVWTKSTTRQTERVPCNKQAEVIFGLHNIHGKLKYNRNNELVKHGTVINDSRFGACLQLSLNEMSELSVGDLINYELKNNENNLRFLAVIRWIKRQPNHFSVGIEFINGKALPVSVRSGNKLTEALLISFASEDSLVIGSGLYKNGAVIRVKLPNHAITLDAYSGPLISRQNDIDHFRISRASAQATSAPMSAVSR